MPLTTPRPYALMWMSATSSNPNNSTTYYQGATGALQTSSGVVRLLVPKSGIVRAVYIDCGVFGTLGSSENATIKLTVNGSSSTTLSTTFQLIATHNTGSFTGLAIPVSAGDYIEIQIDTPVWATKPTTVTTLGSCDVEVA